jgi:hypothetical protein
MAETFIRFIIGGLFVSTFAVLGDILRPKSFAGGIDEEPLWRRGAAPDSIPRLTPQPTINGNGAPLPAQPAKGIFPKCEDRPAPGDQVTYDKQGVPVWHGDCRPKSR